jgi:predicted enzyme related to lactoylglutathione lyase
MFDQLDFGFTGYHDGRLHGGDTSKVGLRHFERITTHSMLVYCEQVRVFCLIMTIFALGSSTAFAAAAASSKVVGVGSQYTDSHVYVSHGQLSAFVTSFAATFDGSYAKPAVLTITPTPSKTRWQAASSRMGLVSAFEFLTPVPYPFGKERTGYLVNDIDAAVREARADGASVVVAPFKDKIGRDAIIEWPGGVMMQLYWHKTAPHAPPLETVPDNRIYVSADAADKFIGDFITFSQGSIESDDRKALGVEVGSPGITYRRVRINCVFGKLTVLVTNGYLPYPFGYDTTGYEVANLEATLVKAKNTGAAVLVSPFKSDGRKAAIVRFPGGYIAEIHSSSP